MAPPRKPLAAADFVRTLEAWAGSLEAGDERRDTIAAGGDLEIDIVMRVRRRAAPDAVQSYRGTALALLGQEPHRGRHCGANLRRRSPWSKHHAPCYGKVVAAVVYQTASWRSLDPPPLGPSHLFVCSRHREKHGIDGRAVLAVVELPESRLAELRKRSELRESAWRASDDLNGKHPRVAQWPGSPAWYEEAQRRGADQRGAV